jgi:hypothetical protein
VRAHLRFAKRGDQRQYQLWRGKHQWDCDVTDAQPDRFEKRVAKPRRLRVALPVAVGQSLALLLRFFGRIRRVLPRLGYVADLGAVARRVRRAAAGGNMVSCKYRRRPDGGKRPPWR